MAKAQEPEKVSFFTRLKQIGMVFSFTAKRDKAFVPLIVAVVLVPLIAVGVAVALGLSWIWAPLGILLTLLFDTLPLVIRTVEPVLLELDVAEEEAAHVLGAGRWTTFRRVVLRALAPAISAGAMLTFARAIGEFGAVVVVSGNNTGSTLTVPVFIFQLTSQFKPEQAAAVATLLFGISFVVVLITDWLVNRPTREAR